VKLNRKARRCTTPGHRRHGWRSFQGHVVGGHKSGHQFTTLFGLLAVELAVSLTRDQGTGLTHILALAFSAVSVPSRIPVVLRNANRIGVSENSRGCRDAACRVSGVDAASSRRHPAASFSVGVAHLVLNALGPAFDFLCFLSRPWIGYWRRPYPLLLEFAVSATSFSVINPYWTARSATARATSSCWRSRVRSFDESLFVASRGGQFFAFAGRSPELPSTAICGYGEQVSDKIRTTTYSTWTALCIPSADCRG